jgi:hypothetical protein
LLLLQLILFLLVLIFLLQFLLEFVLLVQMVQKNLYQLVLLYPIASNDTPEGRAKNRRVVAKIIY